MTSVNTIEAGRYTKLLAETLKKSGDFEQPPGFRLSNLELEE